MLLYSVFFDRSSVRLKSKSLCHNVVMRYKFWVSFFDILTRIFDFFPTGYMNSALYCKNISK